MSKNKKKPYAKPALVYRGKVDVMSAVCNSSWVPGSVCRLALPSCQKTKF